jgi:DNA-binding NarL/FixJ family response regulator
MADTLRVLIVEDRRLATGEVAALLGAQPDMTVIGTAGSVAEAVPRAREQAPDVVLLDFHLPDGTGAQAGTRIRELRPDTKLVFVTDDDSDVARMAAVAVGANAFLPKTRPAAEVVDAIRMVAKGGNLITPRTIASLLYKRRTSAAQLQSLTSREREVLRLIGLGVRSREIADQLGTSHATVRTHIRSLGRKLGIRSQPEALAKARELGLVD